MKEVGERCSAPPPGFRLELVDATQMTADLDLYENIAQAIALDRQIVGMGGIEALPESWIEDTRLINALLEKIYYNARRCWGGMP